MGPCRGLGCQRRKNQAGEGPGERGSAEGRKAYAVGLGRSCCGWALMKQAWFGPNRPLLQIGLRWALRPNEKIITIIIITTKIIIRPQFDKNKNNSDKSKYMIKT